MWRRTSDQAVLDQVAAERAGGVPVAGSSVIPESRREHALYTVAWLPGDNMANRKIASLLAKASRQLGETRPRRPWPGPPCPGRERDNRNGLRATRFDRQLRDQIGQRQSERGGDEHRLPRPR